ncbi:MAG: helix-turn-helix transcriptional regulator [Clostridia bacterium]|nr:helix-turn-helix transcriptional regulator [Clostridia bacterium]
MMINAGFYNIVVTEIDSVFTVNSPKGRIETIRDRKTYGLSFCYEGQITYVHNGRKYVTDRDHAILLPQGESYTFYGDKSGEFPLINFVCREPLCDRHVVIPLHDRERFLREYEQMRSLFLVEGSRMKLLSVFYGMLSRLLTPQASPTLAPALRYMEEHYGECDLTNERIARAAGISEVYFRKLFLSEMRTTPRQYLIELRINRAKQLLSEGKHKMVAISEKCGFSNPYHFCRSFKAATGETPTEYMMRNKRVQI